MRHALSSELLGWAGVVVRYQKPPIALFATGRDEPKENGKHTEEKRVNRENKGEGCDIFIMPPATPLTPETSYSRTFPGLFRSSSFLSPV